MGTHGLSEAKARGLRVAVDIGGTNVKTALVDDDYRILARSARPTDQDYEVAGFVDRLLAQIRDLMDENSLRPEDIRGIGISSAGVIDGAGGRVLYSNNFGWENVPLLQYIREGLKFSTRLAIRNDAQCAVMGERAAGAARGAANVVLLTLGTGVGSGIIVDGKLLEGHAGGGIAGHITVIHGGRLCTCGHRGCLEAYASATGLVADIRESLARCPDSGLAKMAAGPQGISAKLPFEAAAQGDAEGIRIVENYIDILACGIAGLVNVFRPDEFLISGGICNQGDALMIPLNRLVRRYSYSGEALYIPQVKKAVLGDAAGLVGAAALLD